MAGGLVRVDDNRPKDERRGEQNFDENGRGDGDHSLGFDLYCCSQSCGA